MAYKRNFNKLPIYVGTKIGASYNIESKEALEKLKRIMEVQAYIDMEIGKGYSMMGQINKEFAEIGMMEDYKELKEYEDRLTGSDK